MNLEINIDKLRAQEVIIGGRKHSKLEDTPHYLFLEGNKIPYIEYLEYANQPDHTQEIFETLINEFDINKAGEIHCHQDGDHYIIQDGFHRACIMKYKGYKKIKIKL